MVGRLLDHWRSCLTGHEHLLLTDYGGGVAVPHPDDLFPTLSGRPCWTDGRSSGGRCEVNLQEAKALYVLMVECLNKQRIQHRADSPWRAHLAAGEEVRLQWSLYKPPLTKRVADLQWRLIHRILAENAFISILNPAVSDKCPFCVAVETVFHCFAECPRLDPLFCLLGRLFRTGLLSANIHHGLQIQSGC